GERFRKWRRSGRKFVRVIRNNEVSIAPCVFYLQRFTRRNVLSRQGLTRGEHRGIDWMIVAKHKTKIPYLLSLLADYPCVKENILLRQGKMHYAHDTRSGCLARDGS